LLWIWKCLLIYVFIMFIMPSYNKIIKFHKS
jgi:hypothetical protein